MADPDIVWLIRGAILLLLGSVTYFLKRTLDKQDSMEKKIQSLEIAIAGLLVKDRMRRIEDYNRQGNSS